VLIPTTSTAPSPGSPGNAETGVATNGQTSAEGQNPFAMLMALLGGSGVEGQDLGGQRGDGQPNGADGITALFGGVANDTQPPGLALNAGQNRLRDANGEALLSDVIQQLEDGQPLNAEMLEALEASGLIGPDLMGQLQSQLVNPGTVPLTGTGPGTGTGTGTGTLAVADTGTLGKAPDNLGMPAPANIDGALPPGIQVPSGTLGDAANPLTASVSSPVAQTAGQSAETALTGAASQSAPTAAAAADGVAQQATLNAPATAASLNTTSTQEAVAIPQTARNSAGSVAASPTDALEGSEAVVQRQAQPSVHPDQRRTIGGDAPTGFLASLAQGAGAGADGQQNTTGGGDALTALRAALQRSGEQSSPANSSTTAMNSASADAMFAGDGSFTLQDFDIQLGGRPLEALGHTGAPKSVTVTSNGTQLPTHQLALTVATEARAGTRRFEIRLDPPEMGRIDIKLEMQADGSIRSMMTVERPETFDALNRDARQLERLLAQSGLKLDEGGLQLSMGNDGGQQQRDFDGDLNGRQQGGAMASGTLSERAADETTDDLGNPLIAQSGLSGEGAVDIRV
jgi:flagellar hook-length control protein FliK